MKVSSFVDAQKAKKRRGNQKHQTTKTKVIVPEIDDDPDTLPLRIELD